MVRATGLAGHAGTVPMALRRDAAAAAAEIVLFVERRCRSVDGLVGTVGQLSVPQGATNVIPGACEFSLDVRSGDDAVRDAAVADILAEIDAVGARRGVEFAVTPTQTAKRCALRAVADGPARRRRRARRRAGRAGCRRGAGHDAMAIAPLADVAMLFVRCGNGGISHHPDETMTRGRRRSVGAHPPRLHRPLRSCGASGVADAGPPHANSASDGARTATAPRHPSRPIHANVSTDPARHDPRCHPRRPRRRRPSRRRRLPARARPRSQRQSARRLRAPRRARRGAARGGSASPSSGIRCRPRPPPPPA